MTKHILCSICSIAVLAQFTMAADSARPLFAENEVIVRLADSRIEDVRNAARVLNSEAYEVVRVISREKNLFVVRLGAGATVRGALGDLSMNPAILYAQPDYYLTPRQESPSEDETSSPQQERVRIPNDPEFSKMWDMKSSDGKSDIRATQAWDIGTGGKDASGNDIVVAVVDGGVDIAHKDLAENVWVNKAEIAGNSKDDDGNGYVDDINGWNAASNNNNVVGSPRHGTHVAGTIGARGDNNTMVTGINWDVKVMPVVASPFRTSIVLAAYQYVLQQKKLWIESKGEKGANVVATNSSFGHDYADCNSGEYPAWNDIYEAMGKVGILSAAATANIGIDVDVKGDVPTGCKTEYIVSVTNTTIQNKKYASAGYGRIAIDLGAPGTDTLSTFPGNTTGTATGTSMATPHVAGAIAFLHSVASSDFNKLYSESPAQAALELKKMLLNTVDPMDDLKTTTVSGGRLNLFAAAKAAVAFERGMIDPAPAAFLSSLSQPMKWLKTAGF